MTRRSDGTEVITHLNCFYIEHFVAVCGKNTTALGKVPSRLHLVRRAILRRQQMAVLASNGISGQKLLVGCQHAVPCLYVCFCLHMH